MLDVFQDLGRDMFLSGLVGSHTGTMSLRQNGRAIISRRGARLGRLEADDLIDIEIEQPAPEMAPEDAIVHQAIYRTTDAQAVVYARPPATMAMALIEDRLSPANGEGAEVMGSAPVVISQRSLGSSDVAQLISMTLKENRVVALRGHGVFARGADLADAFRIVSLLEEMCRVAHLFRTLAREEVQPAAREWQERQPTTSLSPFRSKNGGPGGQRGGGPPPRDRTVGPPRRNDGGHRQPEGPRRGGGGGGAGRRGAPHR